MKKLIFGLFLSVLFLNTTTAQHNVQRTGFDGDNFSLEGALEIFKQSHSIRDFERKLNTRDSYVNNLDLNFDGRIDYIRVEHRRQGNYHAVILQTPINRRELQDIAVIEIEKTGRRTAMLQIIGDDYLYGNEVIVEPIARGNDTFRNGVVNVYRWNAVRHILGRGYNPWISPYRYSYYPTWWSPWNQFAYYDYYPRTRLYRNHYHFVNVHRVYRVHNFYRPYRVYCPTIVQRSNNVHVINGTTRRPVANNPRRGQTTRANAPTTRRSSDVSNKRRQTSPTRQATTTRVNKQRSTAAPTRSSTRANKQRTTTSPAGTNSSTRATRSNQTNRTRTTATPRRSNTTSSANRNTSRISKSRMTATPQRKATTSSKSSTSRVSSTRKSTRRN